MVVRLTDSPGTPLPASGMTRARARARAPTPSHRDPLAGPVEPASWGTWWIDLLRIGAVAVSGSSAAIDFDHATPNPFRPVRAAAPPRTGRSPPRWPGSG